MRTSDGGTRRSPPESSRHGVLRAGLVRANGRRTRAVVCALTLMTRGPLTCRRVAPAHAKIMEGTALKSGTVAATASMSAVEAPWRAALRPAGRCRPRMSLPTTKRETVALSLHECVQLEWRIDLRSVGTGGRWNTMGGSDRHSRVDNDERRLAPRGTARCLRPAAPPKEPRSPGSAKQMRDPEIETPAEHAAALR